MVDSGAAGMRLNRQQIQQKGLEVLEANPQGIRWVDLLRAVELDAADTPHNSIHGGIHNLLTTRKSEILKVARGTYRLSKFVNADDVAASEQEAATLEVTVKSETFEQITYTERRSHLRVCTWWKQFRRQVGNARCDWRT